MARYRKRPQPVEAVRWDGSPRARRQLRAAGFELGNVPSGLLFVVRADRSCVPVVEGDWVLRAEDGGISTVADDVFGKLYEPEPT